MIAALQLNRPHVIDGLWLMMLTGMRRSDLVALTWGEVGEHAIIRTALKKSRGRRRRAMIPLIPKTVRLPNELRMRVRESGVDTVLVNSLGRSWPAASFGQAFSEVQITPTSSIQDRPNSISPVAQRTCMTARAPL